MTARARSFHGFLTGSSCPGRLAFPVNRARLSFTAHHLPCRPPAAPPTPSLPETSPPARRRCAGLGPNDHRTLPALAACPGSSRKARMCRRPAFRFAATVTGGPLRAADRAGGPASVPAGTTGTVFLTVGQHKDDSYLVSTLLVMPIPLSDRAMWLP